MRGKNELAMYAAGAVALAILAAFGFLFYLVWLAKNGSVVAGAALGAMGMLLVVVLVLLVNSGLQLVSFKANATENLNMMMAQAKLNEAQAKAAFQAARAEKATQALVPVDGTRVIDNEGWVNGDLGNQSVVPENFFSDLG